MSKRIDQDGENIIEDKRILENTPWLPIPEHPADLLNRIEVINYVRCVVDTPAAAIPPGANLTKPATKLLGKTNEENFPDDNWRYYRVRSRQVTIDIYKCQFIFLILIVLQNLSFSIYLEDRGGIGFIYYESEVNVGFDFTAGDKVHPATEVGGRKHIANLFRR